MEFLTMKKSVLRKKLQSIGSNQIDPATTNPDFTKKPRKSKGVAGKGGKTTNSHISEKKTQKGGAENA